MVDRILWRWLDTPGRRAAKFEPTDPGQDMRHMGIVEPLWTLFDLTPGGRPNGEEQIEYDCCHSHARSA